MLKDGIVQVLSMAQYKCQDKNIGYSEQDYHKKNYINSLC